MWYIISIVVIVILAVDANDQTEAIMVSILLAGLMIHSAVNGLSERMDKIIEKLDKKENEE